MIGRALPAALSAAFILASPVFAATTVKSVDRDKDGRNETKIFYDDKKIIRQEKDVDGDGKPEEFKLFLKGRNLILGESDANRDGKIDKRKLVEWAVIKRYPGDPGSQGYRPLWVEEDKDFDGKIDKYRERGKKEDEVRFKLSQPINPSPTLSLADAS